MRRLVKESFCKRDENLIYKDILFTQGRHKDVGVVLLFLSVKERPMVKDRSPGNRTLRKEGPV